jgi:hypothetical protein
VSPDEIREWLVRWYALPVWARQGATGFILSLAALLYVAAVVVGCLIADAVFGDLGILAGAIVGIAGFVGLVVGTISALDVDSTEAAKRRERRTKAEP